MSSTSLRVAVVQQEAWPDKERSLAETERLLEELCREHHPQLVLLQELHTTHYFCQVEDPALFDLAEPLDGPSAQRLAAMARRFEVVLVGGIFEKRAPGVYHNTALVFDKDGSLAGYYRKMHIPDDPAFYEKFYFTPGDAQRLDGGSGFTPIPTSVGKLGLLVCWDQWYPEGARLMALAGADILLYPTAIGWDPDDTEAEKQRQKEAWTLIQRSHAVANHLPVLVANRIGLEAEPTGQGAGIAFWGGSFICGQQGEFLAHADADSATPLVADIDMARTEKLRRIWPYFRDRRIDAYGGLTSRFLKP
ncbi:MAG TPA: carbon-nitrogen hydrolase [Hyphomicrobiales bacterium]|nr:carbon-nitrogen hydrolase [Hyphomicrobiales bacterium]